MEQKDFCEKDTSLSLKTARPADLKAAINDVLQHLPETAVDIEVIAWLRENWLPNRL